MTPDPQHMEQNKYRCETCENRKGLYDIPFCDYWDKKIPITKYGMDLIARIGCASHSDFQSEQFSIVQDEDGYIEKRSIQSERSADDVLDELQERCEYNVEQSEKAIKRYPSLEKANAGAVVAFKAVLEWIAELRKGGEV